MNIRRRRVRADDDYYADEVLGLPKFDVFEKEYDDDYEEDTGLLGPDGRPIVRHHVAPKRNPIGFIWFEDEDDE